MSLRDRWIARSGRPILVGPWCSEIGFEVLYWLPWIARWRKLHNIDPVRLFAIGRGGSALWYHGAQPVELFDYIPPKDLRLSLIRARHTQQSLKQYSVQSWETRLVALIAERLGLTTYHVLHPSRMYQALMPWWEGDMAVNKLWAQLLYEAAFTVPYPPVDLSLPQEYIAVGFYSRSTWQLDEKTKLYVRDLLARLAQHIPLVLLESNLHADDHAPFPIQGNNILTTAGVVTPGNNLAVQSAVIAKAQAFVGTYGGLQQLAVRMGKPTVGLYQDFSGTAEAHKILTERLARHMKIPCFIGRPTDAEFIRKVVLL